MKQIVKRFLYVPYFIIPVIVLLTLILYIIFFFLLSLPTIATVFLIIGIVIGSWKLITDTFQSIVNKIFALDYIAILAITVGLLTQNYLVASVIVLMMSGGNALEDYAQQKAKQSLTALKNRIPNKARIVNKTGEIVYESIEKIKIGTSILLSKGEVVPLDGILEGHNALIDESTLTGEPYPVTKIQHDIIRSGTLNVGDAVRMKTTVTSTDSTYNRIVALVKEAENAKAPFIQLADTLSLWFTILTLLLAGIAYIISGDFERVLAVLVIATPCPLILATPIALIGGMNAAAQQRIIFKQLSTLEILSTVNSIVFDKTGTITIGQPRIEYIDIQDKKYTKKQILTIAEGLEKNSLHPYAKAIVAEAKKQDVHAIQFNNIKEKIGIGIEGTFHNTIFQLASNKKHPDSQVVLSKNNTPIATFNFKDELKKTSASDLQKILNMGLEISIFTGDTLERAKQLVEQLPTGIQLKAHLSPENKKQQLSLLKNQGKIVAMVGDGINDAPALASAHVGLAFSHQEHTAASEAADIVLLGRNFNGVLDALHISRYTMHIAKQSMYIGIFLSILGMLFAIGGLLPPLFGAITQEVIDIAVIINALRASRFKLKS
ncbi:MAG TPA: heavy metal translocating P-type ATPase [Candidatus Woesebacteria bacterium]|nr:heavy metal translocating P-type ATPase [Candidatus Woesebacteria bacterium]